MQEFVRLPFQRATFHTSMTLGGSESQRSNIARHCTRDIVIVIPEKIAGVASEATRLVASRFHSTAGSYLYSVRTQHFAGSKV